MLTMVLASKPVHPEPPKVLHTGHAGGCYADARACKGNLQR